MRRLLVLALVLLVAPVPGWTEEAATADAPKVWNGRDQAKEVKAALAEYFGADDARRAEIRAFLESRLG